MFANIFKFEIRYWMSGFMVYIFLAIIIALFMLVSASDDVTVVGVDLDITKRNAPYVVQFFYAIASLMSVLMVTAFVNAAASRDFAYQSNQIIYTKPIRKFPFLSGRFLGSALVACLPILGVSIAMLAVPILPNVNHARYGDVVWSAHFWGIVNFAIPNVFLISAIIFAIAVWTRSTVASFIGALVLLVGYEIAQQAIGNLDNENLAMLMDPFGINTLSLQTKYWTVDDKNTMALGLTGMMLVNRLIWIGFAALVWFAAYWRFDFAERASRRSKVVKSETLANDRVEVPNTERFFGWSSAWAQLWSQTKVDFLGIVKSNIFIVIMIAGTIQTVAALILTANEGFGLSTLPVTYQMVDVVRGTMYLFMIAVIVFYAGVLVWRERENKLDDVYDALPHPTWIVFSAKLISLTLVVFFILILGMLCGLAIQTFNGFDRYQFGLYLTELLLIDGVQIFPLIVLAMLVHVVSPNKYIGYFAFITLVILNRFFWPMTGIETNLLQFATLPNYTYSDMFGFAPYSQSLFWFGLYWTLFTLLLTVAATLYWQRGKERGPVKRTRTAALRWVGNARIFSLACVVLWLSVGSWIYYNTKILNAVPTQKQQLALQASYEKQFVDRKSSPLPRVTDVKFEIDIFPHRRAIVMKGEQTIVNKSDQPIRELFVTLAEHFDTELEIEGATMTQDHEELWCQDFEFSEPMLPGQSRKMTFTVKYEAKGFENAVSQEQFVQNGTFFNNSIVPQLGYQAGREIEQKNERDKFGLGKYAALPDLDPENLAARRNTYLSNHSDWVNVETVISTSSDQVAIAPGSLVDSWQKDGRKYYRYVVDHPSLNFFSFISAKYKMESREWNGIDIEVYYHPDHEWNVPLMLRSIQKSLEYFSKAFGPYRHKQARIIEFPRVSSFAQAFPGTMPYSEGIGFIADIKHADDIDMVYYVVAHEMAHQWWAHQVIGANMQGATVLSETLAQYSALMVMEQEYGRDIMRKFLEYEMDKYLRDRGSTSMAEKPMTRVGTKQGYVHYRKGSVVMYYLKEMIGEEKVNAALKQLVDKFAYQESPYPTSMDLVQALRDQTPNELQYLIDDHFEKVILFANRSTEATYRKLDDGKFEITLEIECRKLRANEEGKEESVAIDDWIEIGAFAKPESGKRYGATLHRQRIRVTKEKSSHTFVVSELPDQVGVDPFHLLIDRNPGDNLRKPRAN